MKKKNDFFYFINKYIFSKKKIYIKRTRKSMTKKIEPREVVEFIPTTYTGSEDLQEEIIKHVIQNQYDGTECLISSLSFPFWNGGSKTIDCIYDDSGFKTKKNVIFIYTNGFFVEIRYKVTTCKHDSLEKILKEAGETSYPSFSISEILTYEVNRESIKDYKNMTTNLKNAFNKSYIQVYEK